MHAFFVNLPFSYIHRDRGYLDFILEHRLSPELGLDAAAIDCLDERWHQTVAGELTSAGLSCSMHFPFFDLRPGSLDDLILLATRRRLAAARHIAELYAPQHIVAHAGFSDYAMDFYEQWLDRAVETWSSFMHGWPEHPPLFLENTYEQSPDPLVAMLARLASHNTGICFDTGHWHCFAKGGKRKNLSAWLHALSTYMRHLHLHDIVERTHTRIQGAR
ncbi:MAG: TIM barrel protein [Pseudomonadota bacterium]